MKNRSRFHRCLILALCALACALFAADAGARSRKKKKKEPPRISWEKSLDDAKNRAHKYHRPILIHICPHGKMGTNEDRTVFFNNEVRELARYVVFYRVDPENATDMIDKYKVDTEMFPCIIIVDVKLERLWKNIEGHCDWFDLVTAFRAVLKKHKPLSPSNLAKLLKYEKMVDDAIEDGKFSKAIKYLKKMLVIKPKNGFTDEAAVKMAEITNEAKAMLDKAAELYDAARKEEALDLYRKLSKLYKGLPEARAAVARATVIRKEIGASAAEIKQESKKLLDRGRMLEENGKKEQAAELYRKIIQEYPTSPYARSAKERLARLELDGAK